MAGQRDPAGFAVVAGPPRLGRHCGSAEHSGQGNFGWQVHVVEGDLVVAEGAWDFGADTFDMHALEQRLGGCVAERVVVAEHV